jgi:hypothetical protein
LTTSPASDKIKISETKEISLREGKMSGLRKASPLFFLRGKSDKLAVPFLIFLAVCLFVPSAYAKYSGGSGVPNDPYQIATAEDLMLLGESIEDYDNHFILTADIDMDPNLPGRGVFDRAVIAPDMDPDEWGAQGTPFTGVFDGNGKLISNFNYVSTDSTDTEYAGLFGWLEHGKIKDLKLVNPNINANKGSYIGALIGRAVNATIAGCCVEGGCISGKDRVGGLIGSCSDTSVSSCYSKISVTGETTVGGLVGFMVGQIDSCHSEGNITGKRNIGGLVGYNYATMRSCYSSASVAGTDDHVGGLVGISALEIISCQAYGNVEGNNSVGGLVGTNDRMVTCSYATGDVQGRWDVGGLVGSNDGWIRFSYSTGQVLGDEYGDGLTKGGSVYLCYWDTETSGISESGAGKGRTTEQMQSAATYRGWGHECQWVLDEGNDYPRLIWEDTPGELLVDQLPSYDGGNGEPNDPYQIYTAQQFASIAYYLEHYDEHFILTNDIDLSTISPDEITPIGSIIIPFTGSFLGNGHTIMNLNCMAKGQDFIGLFGYIGQNGYVEDLQLVNVSVTGNEYVGGLVGYNLGSIDQCSVTGTVKGNDKVGGLVGLAGFDAGPITRCSTDVQITGSWYVGGLVGCNWSGAILACYSNSSVVGLSYVGGLVGLNRNRRFSSQSSQAYGQIGPPPGTIPYPTITSISSCYSTGYVEGHHKVGGLAGENGGSIQFSYSSSRVVEANTAYFLESIIGGLVGENDYGVVLLSYWDAEQSGLTYSDGGKSKTTEQMMHASTFSGWGYSGKWVIDEGNDYPRLVWEGLGGKLIIDAPNRYAEGTGQTDDPYKIQTADEFLSLTKHPIDWDKCFVLTNDIDLISVDPNLISPIGVYGTPFTGVFDGNNYTISNYKYLSETEGYFGVFGSIGPETSYRPYTLTPQEPNSTGSVVNLILENVEISANFCTGGLVGYNGGMISNCLATGNVEAVQYGVGGLIGYNNGEVIDCNVVVNVISERVAGGLISHNKGYVRECSFGGTVLAEGTDRRLCSGGLIAYNNHAIESCHFNGEITGKHNTGGLIGINVGTVLDCSASGGVAGTQNVGGLVGSNNAYHSVISSFSNSVVIGEDRVGGLVGNNTGQILNCYATANVSGHGCIGGLVGWSYHQVGWNYYDPIICNCYSAGSVTGEENVGGLAGEVFGDIESSFWDIETGGQTTSDYGIGKTTAEMQMASTFLEAGWDFVGETENGTEDIWWILEGQDYPRLWWENEGN